VTHPELLLLLFELDELLLLVLERCLVPLEVANDEPGGLVSGIQPDVLCLAGLVDKVVADLAEECDVVEDEFVVTGDLPGC
jgi:hypothetical protein